MSESINQRLREALLTDDNKVDSVHRGGLSELISGSREFFLSARLACLYTLENRGESDEALSKATEQDSHRGLDGRACH